MSDKYTRVMATKKKPAKESAKKKSTRLVKAFAKMTAPAQPKNAFSRFHDGTVRLTYTMRAASDSYPDPTPGSKLSKLLTSDGASSLFELETLSASDVELLVSAAKLYVAACNPLVPREEAYAPFERLRSALPTSLWKEE